MELLDEIEKSKNRSNRFSNFSFFFALMTLLLFFYLFSKIPTTIDAKNPFYQPNTMQILTLNLSYFLGSICAILSFVKKEPNGFMKWVGAIVNGLFTLGFLITTYLAL